MEGWCIGDGSEYRIRQLQESDIDAAIALEKEVGWCNHASERPWRMFMENNPICCLAAVTVSGLLVGTTCGGITDDKKYGLIAAVIVTSAHRRKGICEALVRKADEILISQGVQILGLDASAMGYGIYKRIGFMDQNTHNRLYMADNFRTALSVFSRSELDEAKGLAGIAERKLLAHTDRLSFGADRTSILANRAIFPYGYILPQMALLMPVKPSEGLLCKEGAMSLQIGPIYAHNEHSLRILLAALCLNAPESLMKGVQVYIPDTAPSYSSTTFISLGFVECVGRECRPMRLPVDPSCNITLPAPFCCATAGPDLG